MIKLFQLVFLVTLACSSQAQLIHTRHFSDLLEKRGLEFTPSEVTYFHALPREKDSYHEYDLVLRSDEKKVEYRYILPDKSLEPGFYPHIYVASRLSSVATNEEYGWLNVRPLGTKQALDEYGCEWALEGSFRPKEDFSGRKTGKIKAFFSEKGGLVIIYILFDRDEDLPPEPANLLRFRGLN